jgi:hypothetical protein
MLANGGERGMEMETLIGFERTRGRRGRKEGSRGEGSRVESSDEVDEKLAVVEPIWEARGGLML